MTATPHRLGWCSWACGRLKICSWWRSAGLRSLDMKGTWIWSRSLPQARGGFHCLRMRTLFPWVIHAVDSIAREHQSSSGSHSLLSIITWNWAAASVCNRDSVAEVLMMCTPKKRKKEETWPWSQLKLLKKNRNQNKKEESQIISGRGPHRSYDFVNFKDNNEFKSIDLKTFTIMCKKRKQTAQIYKIARANRTSRMQKMTRTLEETALQGWKIYKKAFKTRWNSKRQPDIFELSTWNSRKRC